MAEKGMWEGIEDKWYAFLDWLDERGIPVYNAVDPIEAKNIPSLPFFLGLGIILLILVAYGANLAFFNEGTLTVTVKDLATGDPVITAEVAAKQGTQLIDSKMTDKDGIAKVKIKIGKEMTLTAAKNDYSPKEVKYTGKESEEIGRAHF